MHSCKSTSKLTPTRKPCNSLRNFRNNSEGIKLILQRSSQEVGSSPLDPESIEKQLALQIEHKSTKREPLRFNPRLNSSKIQPPKTPLSQRKSNTKTQKNDFILRIKENWAPRDEHNERNSAFVRTCIEEV